MITIFTTGSGLYIFFILANYVPYATTLTHVNFFLDGVLVSSFLHVPAKSTNYEYNQVVYANDAIPYGQHTMMVAPVNDSVNNVLILFDYLIYTCVLSLILQPAVLIRFLLARRMHKDGGIWKNQNQK